MEAGQKKLHSQNEPLPGNNSTKNASLMGYIAVREQVIHTEDWSKSALLKG